MIETQLMALAVENRRHIYDLLIERPRSVQELADQLPISRPAVSQHLKVLTDARLAKSSNVGTRRIYSADPAGVAALRQWADQMWSDAVGRFADFATATTKEETMLDKETRIEPVVKSLTLTVSPEEAFSLFTEQIASWWPLASHSVGESKADSVLMEPGIGGRILETTVDGVEHVWGIVTVWDQGERVEFTWHPGLPQDQETLVDVRFRKVNDGTEMILIHSGWEARGEDGPTVRDNYNRGWDFVLGEFGQAI